MTPPTAMSPGAAPEPAAKVAVPRDVLVVIIIWLVCLFAISMGANLIVAPAYAIEYFDNRTTFVLLLGLPGFLILGVALCVHFFVRSALHAGSIMLPVLVWYCMYVVGLSGGIGNSPFMLLIPLVLLFANPYLGEDKRKVFLDYLGGVVAVGVLWFVPHLAELGEPKPADLIPPEKAAAWRVSPLNQHVVVAGLTVIAILGELALIELHRQGRAAPPPATN